MQRDSDVYLEDIVTSIGRIRDYTAGLTRETFVQDQKTVDAVVRNLEIVGDAVKRIPDDVRARASEVDRPLLVRLRKAVPANLGPSHQSPQTCSFSQSLNSPLRTGTRS